MARLAFGVFCIAISIHVFWRKTKGSRAFLNPFFHAGPKMSNVKASEIP
jgi:hypothetical protein